MRKLIGLFLLTLVSAASASDFKMTSRNYEENLKGEIIQVDGETINSRGEIVLASDIMRSKIKGDGIIYINTQHILIPANSEVRKVLLDLSGDITVEGTILEEKIIKSDIAKYKQIKVLVREVK